MEIVRERSAWRALLDERRLKGDTIGFVPTMGALHAGHLSLCDAVRARTDFVGVSIFVNPLQFGDPSDLAAYPRDLDDDASRAEAAGVDAIFAPSVEEMYPRPPSVVVSTGPLAHRLEGSSRPGHFDGVATVVTRLLGLSGPCVAAFGEKDYQQLAIVRALVEDLEIPVQIVSCPIVREPDGLAMSSRNRRLSGAGRLAALALSEALELGARLVESGERSPGRVGAAMTAHLAAQPLVTPDYAVAVDPDDLVEPVEIASPVRLLVAATVEEVRLIDNRAASPPGDVEAG